MKYLFILPLIVFLGMSGFLARGLFLDPGKLPSPLIDKSAPPIQLPQLHTPDIRFNSADMIGQVWMLNVWASWCTACRVEHPLFIELSERRLVPIVGLNYKDKSLDAMIWLNQLGNPYAFIASDTEGRAGIDWGVYGVPETFLIGRKGNIRYKHVGPVDQQSMDETIQPLIKALLAESI